jgi:hypothetical protein
MSGETPTPGGTPGTTPTPTPTSTSTPGETPALSWDDWLKEQPEPVKALLDGHTSGLKSALDSERTAKKDLEKKLRDAAKHATDGSELQKELQKVANDLAEAQARADFFEAAAAAEVTNPRLAYIAARDAGLMDDKRGADFGKLKQQFPELFKKPVTPAGNAGSGTGGSAPAPTGNAAANFAIRRAAGRG